MLFHNRSFYNCQLTPYFFFTVCKGLFGAKKANVTVEIVDKNGNVIAKDTVSVVFYKLSIQLTGVDAVMVAFFGNNKKEN